MTTLDLSANECRVIGCLIEKSITTPDQYPLTLNALTNACNQKSSREPVMNLNPGSVQQTVRELETRHQVRVEENFSRGVEKYTQRFCNTKFSEFQFEPPQLAIVCLMLLRGAQTPGELRARSGRLYEFADNNEVVEALNGLAGYPNDPLVVQLPRSAGRKDSEYMHLFAGPVDIESYTPKEAVSSADKTSNRVSMAELTQRVANLEAEVEQLKELLTGSNNGG
ncbi:MAG: hypothetical protein ACI9LO_001099 [Planctomycetota bacterium]|jgi:uncharacterized protein YceH (UPF0502 family)